MGGGARSCLFLSVQILTVVFFPEEHAREICVTQDFSRLASEAVNLLECTIDDPSEAENRKIPYLIRDFI